MIAPVYGTNTATKRLLKQLKKRRPDADGWLVAQEDSGSYPAPKKWMRFKVVNQGTESPSVAYIDLAQRFEEDVKFWLEQLRSSGFAEANQFPDEAKDALEDYVITALSQGVVRGGGPREASLEPR